MTFYKNRKSNKEAKRSHYVTLSLDICKKEKLMDTYHFVFSLAESNALGSFVYIEKRPHTMARAVVKVQPQIPQWQARDAVKAGAQGTLGENQTVQANVTL